MHEGWYLWVEGEGNGRNNRMGNTQWKWRLSMARYSTLFIYSLYHFNGYLLFIHINIFVINGFIFFIPILYKTAILGMYYKQLQYSIDDHWTPEI